MLRIVDSKAVSKGQMKGEELRLTRSSFVFV